MIQHVTFHMKFYFLRKGHFHMKYALIISLNSKFNDECAGMFEFSPSQIQTRRQSVSLVFVNLYKINISQSFRHQNGSGKHKLQLQKLYWRIDTRLWATAG